MALLWTLHAEAPAEDLPVIAEAVLSHLRSPAEDAVTRSPKLHILLKPNLSPRHA
jgi:hypothetical protein